jgi:hypothetical protein
VAETVFARFPVFPRRGFWLPILGLIALVPEPAGAQTLKLPVTEVRILGCEDARARAASRQSSNRGAQQQAKPTTGTRLSLHVGPAPSFVTGNLPAPESGPGAAVAGGPTRVHLSLVEPTPEPPRRLAPPPDRHGVATTWQPAAAILPSTADALPFEPGSVRLTFHTAGPATLPASDPRLIEERGGPSPQRPAATDRADWERNPLRIAGPWQNR